MRAPSWGDWPPPGPVPLAGRPWCVARPYLPLPPADPCVESQPLIDQSGLPPNPTLGRLPFESPCGFQQASCASNIWRKMSILPSKTTPRVRRVRPPHRSLTQDKTRPDSQMPLALGSQLWPQAPRSQAFGSMASCRTLRP